MILENRDSYLYLLVSNDDDDNLILNKLNFLKKVPEHIIINIKSKLINKKSLILSFLKYSSFWKKKNKSFILVVQESSFDVFSGIICVPTLDEAIDYFYMEELERNV